MTTLPNISTLRQDKSKANEYNSSLGDALNCMPEVVRNYINEWHRVASFPISYSLLSCLATLGGAIGKGAKIVSPHGQTENANLYGIIVGPNGARKTPPMKQAFRPLQAIDRERTQEYNKALKEWDGKEDAPQNQQRFFQDFSFEGLIQVLNTNGGTYFHFIDEIIGLFETLKSDKSTFNTDNIIEFWEGGGYNKVRKSDKYVIDIPSVIPTILGSTQPHELRNIFNARNQNNGLFARFLFSISEERVFTNYDVFEVCDPDIIGKYDSFIGKIIENSANRNQFIFSKEGVKEWQKFGNYLNGLMLKCNNDLQRGRDAKLERYFLRFCLILQYLDFLQFGGEQTVTQDTAKRAACITLYFRSESDKVIEILDGLFDKNAFTDKDKLLFNALPKIAFSYSQGLEIATKKGISSSSYDRAMSKYKAQNVVSKHGNQYSKDVSRL